MIAKIGHGESVFGALQYNQQKVEQWNAQVLFTHRMREAPNGAFSTTQLYASFEPYLLANARTEKPALHISLNPDPKDKVSDENFIQIAQDYMQQMGYGDQPYVVFKHNDIERTHIHIVSTNVDRHGKKISDTYEKLRSMDICRVLEKKYKLIPATEKQRTGSEAIFRPVDYTAADIKSQIASVVRHLPKHYQFQGLGAYNALLSLFNIMAVEVKGELHGRPKEGLVYFALNEQGVKCTKPFKASLFGKQAGPDALREHFIQAKKKLKDNPVKAVLKNTIEATMNMATSEAAFKKQLIEQGINTVVRRNEEGRIYGMTFIDHESRTVFNGSQLDKNLSANIFNDYWKSDCEVSKNTFITPPKKRDQTPVQEAESQAHHLFDFLNTKMPEKSQSDLIEALGGWLPGAQGDDYEELAFENQVKKKRRKRRPGENNT